MTKTPRSRPALPSGGGSFVRTADGGLKPASRPEMENKAGPSAKTTSEKPVEPPLKDR